VSLDIVWRYINPEIIVPVIVYSHFNHPSPAAEVLHMPEEPGVGLSIPPNLGARNEGQIVCLMADN
jgi:hypothetical protein